MSNDFGSMPPVFEADKLSKFYGAARGIEDVSLRVHRGELFGFLGPNGAGKTTVMRTALGLLKATSGEVRLFGDRVTLPSDRNHERLGYLPADLRLWPGMSARKISDLMMKIGGGPRHVAWRDQIAERLELNLDRRVRSLSLGNRQKVGLMLALQHKPELLILDEPTSGLDPLVRRTVTDILRELAANGTTIIYSSHNLPEVEQVCSRVGILRKGTLVALKTIDEIRAEEERRLRFLFAAESPMPAELPPELAKFKLVSREGRTWEVRYHGSPDAIIKWLAGFAVENISMPQINLEESFMNYYRDDATNGAAKA